MRVIRTAVAALFVAGFLAQGAGAWTKLTPDTLSNIARPKVLLTAKGTELMAYYDDNSKSIVVVRNGQPVPVVSAFGSVGEPQIIQLLTGALVLYFDGSAPGLRPQGIWRSTSPDDGATWSAPIVFANGDLGEVLSGAVRPDGTPIFLNRYGPLHSNQGLNIELRHEISPGGCCTYGESLAVDSKGLAQIAVYSNANPPNAGTLYGTLDATGALAGPFQNVSGGKEVVPRNDNNPLVADRVGNTFLSWTEGSPPTALHVQTRQAGVIVHDVVVWRQFSGDLPHMALAVDGENQLWVSWTTNSRVYGARSRSGGAHFGAPSSIALPQQSSYQLSALARADGGLSVFVNLGKAISSDQLLPGLTVAPLRKIVHVYDDGVPVAGATVKGGGRTFTTDANGKATLARVKPKSLMQVTMPGYAPASFKAR